MRSFAKTLYNLSLNKLPIYRHIKNKISYPELNIDPSVNLNIKGRFIYQRGSLIQEGANIIVPEMAILHLGEECYIGRYVELGPSPSSAIEIGDFTSLQDRCILVGNIEIGRYCLISLNVLISSGKHYFDKRPWLLIREQDELIKSEKEILTKKKVIIGDDCWIGINSVILEGVTIGKGCVIGANSVVTKDVPPFSVVAGAPAKVIKKRLEFDPPIEISYDNVIDYPYFYSGFEISANEREKSKATQGLYAKNKFQLALATQQCKKIYLKVKTTFGYKTIGYHEQTKLISDNFEEISFDFIPENNKNILEFICIDSNIKSKIIIEKVWVK